VNVSSESQRSSEAERAIAHFRRNELDEATRLAQAVLQTDAVPRDVAVCRQLLGMMAHRAGRYEEAIAHFQIALSIHPDVAELRAGLGEAHAALARRLRKLSRWTDAERHAREGVRWLPESPETLNVLGVVLHEQDKFVEAERWFELGVKGSPQHPQLRLNYANLLAAMHKYDAAIEHYRVAMELRPHDVRTMLSAGGVMTSVSREQEAISLLERALRLDDQNADVHFNLGNAHVSVHQATAATRHYELAVKLRPDWHTARANWLRQRAEICDWRDDWNQQVSAVVSELAADVNGRDPLPLNVSQMPGLPIPRQLMRQTAIRQTEQVRRQMTQLGIAGPRHAITPASASSDERLRIGYFSYDLRHHATGHLACELFAHHDRSRFEVFTYSLGPNDQSEYRLRIEKGSEHFCDAHGWTDPQIIRRIMDDRVDVLIDLQGYSREARAGVLLARPAPVLIHYLGFPGTLGGLVDYFVTDPVLTPPGSALRDEFEEALLYLPDTYQVTDGRPTVSSLEMTRDSCGLPRAGFVFCSFNNNYKIQPETFSVWMRILREVPDSVLWLLSMQADVVDNLRREATRRGVDPARLVFADVVSKPEHLARLSLADLFLDTTVCGAHTTATDSLWAGVPVLTCPGERFTERVAASLITAAGLNELIVDRLEDYERLAIELASNPDRLQRIRDDWSNRRATSRLFNTAAHVRQLEQAYELAWQRHRDGLAPTDLFVTR
jgi:protein O-GlcNAc transferase